MLQIKNKFHLKSRNLTYMAPQPTNMVPAIADDGNDDNWELTERPDGSQLVEFWETVEKDIRRDPTWFSFED